MLAMMAIFCAVLLFAEDRRHDLPMTAKHWKYTATLESESGASLKASGFICDGEAGGLNWTGQRKRKYFVAPEEMKRRWVKYYA